MAMSGRARSALIIGGQGIRSRKLRTLLSMASLFLGVLAVVTVQAGSEIAHRALLADVDLSQGKDGTVRLFLPPNPQAVSVVLDTMKDQPGAVAMIQTLATIGEPGLSPHNPGAGPFDGYEGRYYGGPGQVDTPPGEAISVVLVGVTGDIRQFRPFVPDSGQWLDFSGPPSLSPRVVLNREAAKGLTRYQIPAELQIPGAPTDPTPRIVGVVHDAGSTPTVYVRADELLNWMPPSAWGNQGGIEALLSPTASDVEQTLRARLVAKGVPADQISRMTINTTEQYQDQLSLMQWIFFGMALLVLLIGVAGILNVGLATVGERVEEFALRRAVGMSRLLLAAIVLAETLIIGLLTSVAAIGAGIAGLKLVSHYLSRLHPFLRNVDFPWQAGVAGVIAGLAAGVLGGLVPAIRAARIPIATVMRA